VELGPLNASGTPRRKRKIGRWILLALGIAVGIYAVRARRARSVTGAPNGAGSPAAVGADSSPATPTPAGTPTPAADESKPVIVRVVPEDVRIKIEVLNATPTQGLARRGMFALRDAGFDVVSFGSTKERVDTTIVFDRTGHPEWAALAVKTLSGPVRIVREADDSRYVDLTILLGNRWTPPREPFHP
jgi:hypothetical protein